MSLKHICAHMENQLAEKRQVQGGVPFHATTHAGQHSLVSRHFGLD